MKFLVLSCSLNPDARSRILAKATLEPLRKLGVNAEFVDLRDHPLPLCDGADAYDDPESQWVKARVKEADGILLASPIYNWGVNAVAKNVVEIIPFAAAAIMLNLLSIPRLQATADRATRFKHLVRE